MNIKIKSSGVYCLISEDYDRVYSALKNQFTEDTAQLFTERVPGYEYLQWELPGTGWVSLAEGDPLMAQEVRRELVERQKVVMNRFGANQDMAQRVLSVPDDSYVYYKPREDGSLLIRLTAWGYRYPERILGSEATGTLHSKDEVEHVRVKVVYDGKGYPCKSLKLNGFTRVTDDRGILEIGSLPVGYQFDVDVEDVHQHVKVVAGQNEILIDLTRYTMVDAEVLLDGKPSAGHLVDVAYLGRKLQLTTDNNGHARVKLPLDPENGFCTVSTEGETQQQALSGSVTEFRFSLVSPPPAEEPLVEEPPVVEVPSVVPDPAVEPKPEKVEEPAPEEGGEVSAPISSGRSWAWLRIALLLLLLVILTVFTYLFSMGLLTY